MEGPARLFAGTVGRLLGVGFLLLWVVCQLLRGNRR